MLKEYRSSLDLVDRNASTGVVRLRLDPDQVEEVRDYALRQGIETIRGRVDKLGVAEPTIIKKGTDIIVELPGLKPADFERIKSIIGRTAQLEFKIVDDDSDFMKKIAPEAKKVTGIDVSTESWTEKDAGKSHEDVYFRSKNRETLQKFFSGLTGELAVPADHEILVTRRRRPVATTAAQTPDRFWRIYTCKRRAALTGEYLSNADQTWDQQTGRPEVRFEFDHQGAAISERMTTDNIGRKMAISSTTRSTARRSSRGVIAPAAASPWAASAIPSSFSRRPRTWSPCCAPARCRRRCARSRSRRSARRSVRTPSTAPSCRCSSAPRPVILFMLFYYRFSGVIANLAMVLNILFQVAILADVPGDADPARHRRPGADHRHGGRLEHHHLRAHPRGAARRQDGARAPSTPASGARSGRSSTRT